MSDERSLARSYEGQRRRVSCYRLVLVFANFDCVFACSLLTVVLYSRTHDHWSDPGG